MLTVVSTVLGLLAGLVLMAFVEHALHRWVMHGLAAARLFPFLWDVFERHARLHHGRYYRKDFTHDDDPAARHLNIEIDAGFSLLGLAPLWLPVCLWVSPPAGMAMAAVIGLHAVAWTQVHREMHVPRRRWFASTRWYLYLAAYHHAHHLNPGRNFNVVFPPFVDLLFGTYTRPVPVVPGRP